MDSTKQKNIPTGIYLLSGLSFLLILDTVLYLISDSAYLFLAIILIPIYLYLSIGSLKGWPKIKTIFMVVAMLLFVGTVSQFIALWISENFYFSDTVYLLRAILGLVIPILVYVILKSRAVAKYLEPAT
jgi:hypothetical protein